MPSDKNVKQIEKIEKKLETAKSVVLAEYHGLGVEQMTELRQKVVEAGGELMVAKNTLLKIVFDKSGYQVPTNQLTGPNMVLFGYEDMVAPLKALDDFAQDNELPKLKCGILIDKNEYLGLEKVEQLAKLPGKEELLAKVVATINAPRVNLVFALKANLQNLVMTLKAISQQASA